MPNLLKILNSAILASSLALTGCNLSYISTIKDPTIAQNNPFSKIEDDSQIGKYFLSKKKRKSLDDSGVMSELEERIEYSASSYFGRKVEISTPYYTEAGYRVILANRGELGIIDVQAIPFWKLSDEQIKAIQYNAERGGLNVHSYKKVEGEPLYAAYVSGLGGFAFSLLFTHVIVMDNDKDSLYNVTSTFAHEGTHHFIEMAEPYFQLPVIFYPNERMSIVETASEVIGNKVALQFEKDHLIPGSRLQASYVDSRKSNEKAIEVWQEIIKRFNDIPLQQRKKNRNTIVKELSDYASEQFSRPCEINEANMSLAERYGGMPERYAMMSDIADTIGPTDFISLVADIQTDAQLKIAHDYVVNKGLHGTGSIERLRDYFRKKDTDWPSIY